MNIVKVYHKIDNVFLINNNLCYTKSTGIYINQNLITYNKGDYVFTSNEKVFLVRNKEKGLYKYNDASFDLISNEYTSLFVGSDNNYILKKINEDNFPVITYFKTSNSEFSLEGLNSILYFTHEYIIVYDTLKRKEILKSDLKGNVVEKINIKDGFKIYLVPELIDNILYFTAYNEGQRNQLVTGLDIDTGKVVWQNQYEVTNENKFISAPAFNPKDKLYYGFGHIYQVFDPKTGEIVFEKTFEESAKYNLLPDVNAVYENKLWFVSGKFEKTKFGYINIDTQEIELIQDFPQENDEVFDTPVYHEGKLYLRGKFYNNLYVFE